MNEISRYKKTFEFEGKSYDVKVFSPDHVYYSVKVFFNRDTANGFSYGVDCDMKWGFASSDAVDAAVNALIDTAMEDVKNKRWEKLAEARK